MMTNFFDAAHSPRGPLTNSNLCSVCLRQDPVDLLDSLCAMNGRFKPACVLAHSSLANAQGQNPQTTDIQSNLISQQPAGGIVSQVKDFFKSHLGMQARPAQNSGASGTNPATLLTGANDLATLLANSGADIQTRLASVRAIEASIVGTTIEERVAAASRLWKVVAALCAVVGSAGGIWFQSDRAKPAPEPVVVSARSLPEKEKTSLRLELAQDCLNAGSLDCANQLVDPVLRTDSNNAAAQKIKTDVKNKQAQLPAAAQGDGKQSQQMLLSLAAGNVSLAKSCLAAGNIDCVATLASLVLQTVPEGDSAGQQIRTEAESLQNRASEMSPGGMKTKHTPPPRISIK